MPTIYIPTQDAALDTWAANFATRLSASPATFGLAGADAATVAAAQSQYSTDLAIATTTATRTPVTVATKDTSRNQLLVLLRAYSMIIQSNIGVSQADKTDLGLTIRKTTKTPITTPSSAPAVAVVSQVTGDISMTYHDPNVGPRIKAKPFGVIQMELAFAVSPTVVTDAETLPFRKLATKTPFHVTTDPADRGKTMYYAARWITRTGLFGPWSAIGTVIVS